MGCPVVGRDHIGHRLGLRKVHFTGQECPQRKFAGLGRPYSGLDQQPHDFALNIRRRMARNFDHILAGIGVRSAEYRNQHFVDNRFAVADRPVKDRKPPGISQPPAAYPAEDPVAGGNGSAAADADQRNGSPDPGGNGGYRIVLDHRQRMIFRVCPIFRLLFFN